MTTKRLGGKEYRFIAPGKPVRQGMTVQPDGTAVAEAEYDDGTIFRTTMDAHGNATMECNKPVRVDETTGEIRVMKD